MNKKNIFKLGFSLFLLTVMTAGFAATSDAQLIIQKDDGGPSSTCPANTCPADLSGCDPVGWCQIDYGHCVEHCQVWENPITLARCYDDDNCSWY